MRRLLGSNVHPCKSVTDDCVRDMEGKIVIADGRRNVEMYDPTHPSGSSFRS